MQFFNGAAMTSPTKKIVQNQLLYSFSNFQEKVDITTWQPNESLLSKF